MDTTRASKFLSLVLRHQPEKIGIRLDPNGWVDCGQLLAAAHGMPLDYETLLEIVRTSDKQRFALGEDGTRIRANQGHSVVVDLGLPAYVPPDLLYHGTVDRFIASIRQQGLLKGRRHHVHLSTDRVTAVTVGKRRGNPVILTVHAKAMNDSGHAFYRSGNGVWLTDTVPPEFIQFPRH